MLPAGAASGIPRAPPPFAFVTQSCWSHPTHCAPAVRVKASRDPSGDAVTDDSSCNVWVTRASLVPFGATAKTSAGGAQSPAYTAPLPSGSACTEEKASAFLPWQIAYDATTRFVPPTRAFASVANRGSPKATPSDGSTDDDVVNALGSLTRCFCGTSNARAPRTCTTVGETQRIGPALAT